MIGKLITWLIAIIAITLSVITLVKNFSKEGPPGKDGERGPEGDCACVTRQDMENAISQLKSQISNGDLDILATKLKQGVDFKYASELNVNSAKSATNATNATNSTNSANAENLGNTPAANFLKYNQNVNIKTDMNDNYYVWYTSNGCDNHDRASACIGTGNPDQKYTRWSFIKDVRTGG